MSLTTGSALPTLGFIRQGVGGDDGWRGHFASLAQHVIEGTAETCRVKLPELPYFLREAAEQGIALPLTEALYAFLFSVEPRWSDNMNRPTVSFWHELARRHRPGDGLPGAAER
jgi:hypothetical protein